MALASLAVAGCTEKTSDEVAGGDTVGSADRPAAGAVVYARDFHFSPSTVWLQRGTYVEWRAGGDAPHTADSDDDTWHAGSIPPDNPPGLSFAEVGDFPYHCENHAQMRGTIHVRG